MRRVRQVMQPFPRALVGALQVHHPTRGSCMKRYLLTAVAATAIAAPAQARDGQPYIGIEGGILFPKDQDADVFVDYTTTQTVPTNPLIAGPADFTADNAFGIDYKK